MKQLLLSTTILVFNTLIISAQTVYVDIRANGDNDGSSWRDAYTSLHDALDESPDGAKIWMSKGTYALSSQDESYVIKKAVEIYGGFKGTESSLSQRDVIKNKVDLSGDVLDNDDYDSFPNNKDENSLHILVLNGTSSEVVLDGLTIRGGQTLRSNGEDFTNNDFNGGAILNLGASVTIRNCTFYENFADGLGGVIFVDPRIGVDINIEDCLFKENGSNQEGGVIMVNTDQTNLVVKNSVFDDNFSLRGGAIRFRGEDSTIDLDGCEFKDNFVTAWGGAVSVNRALEFNMNDCIIEDNRASEGAGGVYMFNIKSAIIDDCKIRRNKVTGVGEDSAFGAGLFVGDNENTLYGTNVTLRNSDIIDNESNFLGGGIMVEGGKLEVIDTRIHGNSAARAGGGAVVIIGGDLILRKTEVSENLSEEGAGLYFQNTGEYLIEDCDINENEASGSGGGIYVDLDTGGVLPIEKTKLEKNTSNSSGGGIFVNEGTAKIIDGEFIKNEAVYGGGISNNYLGSIVEIDGSKFDDNNASNVGGAIEGFDNAVYKIDDCEFTDNAANQGGAIGCDAVRSLTISNSEIEKNTSDYSGGGISFFNGGSMSLVNSTFNNNESEFSGAVEISGIGTNGLIEECNFTKNIAGNEGGAVSAIFGAELDLKKSSFIKNDSNRAGGALAIASDSIANINHSIEACIFDDNRALLADDFDEGGAGSAIVLWNSNVEIQNSLFINNSSINGGTIQPNDYDSQNNLVSILNCTFARNKNNDKGTILAWDDLNGDQVNLNLQNNIFADSELAFYNDQGEAKVTSLGGNLCTNDLALEVFNHSKDQNNTDPRFKDDRDDFRLSSTSPAINAGVNSNAPDKDIVGYDRDRAVDIGAYESQEVTSVFNKVIPAGDLAVFPNPVSDVLKYSLASDWTGSYNLVVLNVSGQKISEESHLKSGQNVNDKMFVDHLKSGTYILQVSKDEKQSNIPFIKI